MAILHKVGDTVHITMSDSTRYAGTYEVVKVNPTTYKLTNDRVANLKAPHFMVHAGAANGAVAVAPLPDESFESGTVVTLTGVRNVDPKTLYVVTGRTDRGYRVFVLGGSTRYYTGIPAARLTRVTKIDSWSV